MCTNLQISTILICVIFRVVKEEFLIYDLTSFAGDVGGMVGMLLGTSVITLYDAFQKALNYGSERLEVYRRRACTFCHISL